MTSQADHVLSANQILRLENELTNREVAGTFPDTLVVAASEGSTDA